MSAALAGVVAGQAAAPAPEDKPANRPLVRNVRLAVAVVFVVALIVVTLITMRVADWIIDSRVGALDRTLGFLYGAARGILVVAVGLLFFNWLVGQNAPAWVANAKSRPILVTTGTEQEDTTSLGALSA